ncbi:MAG: ankyrin repeat domain-containing protein [bacterium]
MFQLLFEYRDAESEKMDKFLIKGGKEMKMKFFVSFLVCFSVLNFASCATVESKKDGVMMLAEASKTGDFKKVKELLESGVDVNEKTENGWTALMSASYEGYDEIAKFLIEKGSDVNAKTENGRTALKIAKEKGFTEIVELLLKNGAEPSM